MVVMPSHFYKDNKYNKFFSEEGHFSNIVNIQTAQYPLLIFSLN